VEGWRFVGRHIASVVPGAHNYSGGGQEGVHLHGHGNGQACSAMLDNEFDLITQHASNLQTHLCNMRFSSTFSYTKAFA